MRVYICISQTYIAEHVSLFHIYMKEVVMLNNLFYTTGQTGTKFETEQRISLSCKQYERTAKEHTPFGLVF